MANGQLNYPDSIKDLNGESGASANQLLKARNLRVSFGTNVVLDIDALDISDEGTVTALIMGPNGAGKTTFLDLITGFTYPSKGASVHLDTGKEKDIAYASRSAIVRVGLVRTFQHPPVFRSLTLEESIRVAIWNSRSIWSQSSPREKSILFDAVVETLDVSNLLRQPIISQPLSVLRLAELARALVTQPRLLMLDEPTAGSDAEDRENLVHLLTETIPAMVGKLYSCGIYRFSRLTTCVVTHDMQFARLLSVGRTGAPIVHVLVQGKLAASGGLEDLAQNPQLRATYFGDR